MFEKNATSHSGPRAAMADRVAAPQCARVTEQIYVQKCVGCDDVRNAVNAASRACVARSAIARHEPASYESVCASFCGVSATVGNNPDTICSN